MNKRYDIAQPASVRFINKKDKNGQDLVDEKGHKIVTALAKPNTHRPFILFEEIMNKINYQESINFYPIEPISHFTELWKAIENTETWAKYEYYLVARNIGVNEVKNLINDGCVWDKFKNPKTGSPLYLPAFGENQPFGHERCITYNDDYLLIGKAWRCRLIRRK